MTFRVYIPVFAFLTLWSAWLPARPAAAITLEECLNLALKNNPALKEQQLGLHQADEEIREKRARNFGSLALVSSYTHYNLPRTLAPLTPASIATDPAAVATSQDLFTAGVVYELELFTGFAQTRSVQIATLQRAMAQTALKLTREQLIYNVKTLYVNILAQQDLAVSQAAYSDALAKLHQRITRELEQGRKARIDQLKAAAEEEKARAALTRIRGNIRIMKAALASLLDIEPTFTLSPLEISPEAMSPVRQDPSGQIQGLDRLRLSELTIEKNRKNAEKAKSALYPQLIFSSGYGQNFGPNDTTNLHSGDWNNQEVWQAGLNLRWNIFDFGVSRAKIRKARLAARQSELEHRRILLELRKEIQEAVTKINTALSDHVSARAEEELTTESAAIEQVRYDKGAADINDLLQAMARRQLAASRVTETAYGYLAARYYLDYLLERGGS